MKEDFVTYDIAVKLKEKGFDWTCMAHFNNITYNEPTLNYNVTVFDIRGSNFKSLNKLDSFIDAPTIFQVLKWLRKEKCLHIEVISAAYGYVYVVSRTPDMGGTDVKCSDYSGPNNGGAWNEWEDCGLAAIEYVLDNLI